MKLLNFPNGSQFSNFDCGAKTIQMVLVYYGIDLSLEKVMKQAGTTRRYGTAIVGMKKVLKNNKLKIKAGTMTVADIRVAIDKKHPVIVLLQAWTAQEDVDWENNFADGHYVVAIGYEGEKIIFEDPSCCYRTFLTEDELLSRWHDVDTDKNNKKYHNFAIEVYGKKPRFEAAKIVHMD